MKLVVSAKALADAVAAVAQGVAPKTTKPVLATVKVHVREGGVATVAATDTELSVRRVVDGDGDAEEGAVLIDPKRAADWLKEQTGLVTVERDDKGPLIHAGKGRRGGRLELADLDPAEFPDVPADGGAATVTVPTATR